MSKNQQPKSNGTKVKDGFNEALDGVTSEIKEYAGSVGGSAAVIGKTAVYGLRTGLKAVARSPKHLRHALDGLDLKMASIEDRIDKYAEEGGKLGAADIDGATAEVSNTFHSFTEKLKSAKDEVVTLVSKPFAKEETA